MCLNPYLKIYKEGERSFPYIGKTHDSASLFNCGKCIECRAQYIESWQIRWKEELNNSPENSSYMLTLTYNDENLPYMVDTETGETWTTLDYTDVQKFLKALRSRQDRYCKFHGLPKQIIKYHYCGEYGKNYTKRPHYHILLTGVILPISGINQFKNNTFVDIWKRGAVHIGTDVTENTIKYILKYTLKNTFENREIEKISYESDKVKFNLVPEKIYGEKIYDNDISQPFIEWLFSCENREKYENRYITFNEWYNEIKNDSSKVDKIYSNENSYVLKKDLGLRQKIEFRVYKNGSNAGRIIEKSNCSRGIGLSYLTENQINLHHQNIMLGYMDYDLRTNSYKERPLPRYYRDKIFNPLLTKDEKIKYYIDKGIKSFENIDLNRPVRKYRELEDGYEESLIYRRRVLMYQNMKNREAVQNKRIAEIGLEDYIIEQQNSDIVKNTTTRNKLYTYLSEVSRREVSRGITFG